MSKENLEALAESIALVGGVFGGAMGYVLGSQAVNFAANHPQQDIVSYLVNLHPYITYFTTMCLGAVAGGLPGSIIHRLLSFKK